MKQETPTPSAKAFATLPRTQLLELKKRIDEALNEPRTVWKNKNVVAVRLTMAEKDSLLRLAALKHVNVSDEIRAGVRDYLKKQQGWLSQVGKFIDG